MARVDYLLVDFVTSKSVPLSNKEIHMEIEPCTTNRKSEMFLKVNLNGKARVTVAAFVRDLRFKMTIFRLYFNGDISVYN